ncbi:hypothetical protein PV326_001258 [Microctonus aethiopoides]|uniref:Complex I assembly factor TIMMDC1, mitochondrial n=1 Tax=Microctonus aethiopoides TaxID=144406 RepID=A0AA39FVR5_9HYME|nr:hypothetical protein PV326_001258 [Microctonus aethiopoides]KAK0176481.1 hypothetical protein PV328_000612 [Microctonus aethiopoides]
MARFFRAIPAGRIALGSFFEQNYDEVLTPGYEHLIEPKPVGLAGIRYVFIPDKYGKSTPELLTIINMTCISTFSGILLGSYLHGKKAFIDFMENNQATQFVDQMDAKRKLFDTTLLSMGKGALKWGTRIGAFAFLFTTSSTVFAAYIGHHGFVEYIVAGAITGSLLKLNMGIKGMISGGVVGTLLGTVAGIMSSILLYLTGSSMESIQNSQYALKTYRDELIHKKDRELFENEYKNLAQSGRPKDY